MPSSSSTPVAVVSSTIDSTRRSLVGDVDALDSKQETSVAAVAVVSSAIDSTHRSLVGDVDALLVFDSKQENSVAAMAVVSTIVSTHRSLRRPCDDN